MPTQASSDAALQPLSVRRGHLTFRLGLQFRSPGTSELVQGSPAQRYVRIQVASPPPHRRDGSKWFEGLRLADRSVFDPTVPLAHGARVSPLGGLSPLDLPKPDTLVADEWLAVGENKVGQPVTFDLTRPDPPGDQEPVVDILSVAYPVPAIVGAKLQAAEVEYVTDGELAFARELTEDWIAVSLDRFWPPGRASADYIVAVQGVGRVIAAA